MTSTPTPADPDRLSAAEKRRLVRLAAFHTAQMIAEEAQLFAGRLRDSAVGVSAVDALMAFSMKVRAIGAGDAGLLLAVAGEEFGREGLPH